MKRRGFLYAFGIAALGWPLVARAQQAEPMRRIGVLMNLPSDDPEGRARVTAFVQAIQKLGWTEDGNIHTDIRWAADDADRYRLFSEELVALAPHVILASGTPSVAALRKPIPAGRNGLSRATSRS